MVVSQRARSARLHWSGVWPLLKRTFSEYSDDKVSKMAAALAYYTLISLAPLLIVILKVTSVFLTSDVSSSQLSAQLKQLTGPEVAPILQGIIDQTGKKGAGTLATAISIVVAVVGASYVFGELQDSLNTIWGVRPKPGRGIVGFIKDRFISMSMVLGIAFLLLVSMFVSTVAGTISNGVLHRIFGDDGKSIGYAVLVADIFFSTFIVAILFAAIFKILPDVRMVWADVGLGAGVTAVLFSLGKFGLTWYFGEFSPGSAYGAAGSLVAAIVWIYYSSLILYLGAEFTQVYADTYGSHIRPTKNAEFLSPEERAKAAISRTMPAAASDPHVPAATLATPLAGQSYIEQSKRRGAEELRPRRRPGRNFAPPARSSSRTAAVLSAVPIVLSLVVGRLIWRRYHRPAASAKTLFGKWKRAGRKWRDTFSLIGDDEAHRFIKTHGPDDPQGRSWAQWITQAEQDA